MTSLCVISEYFRFQNVFALKFSLINLGIVQCLQTDSFEDGLLFSGLFFFFSLVCLCTATHQTHFCIVLSDPVVEVM